MDHVAVLLVELGLLFVALSALGMVARRLGLSPVPFVLITALAFGEGGIVPLTEAQPFVESAAEIGVVLLLLALGLEFTSAELITSLRRHGSSGLVDLVLNAPPGAIAGVVLGLPWQGCLALAGVTWISSSGIVARLLGDLGRLANRETPAVLSVLVTEDLAMVVYLPLVGALLVGGGALAAVGSLAVAAAAAAVTLVVALRYGDRIARLLEHSSQEVLLLGALGLVLLVAGAAERLQVSAAVGAFLVGIALSGEVAHRTRELLTPLRDFAAALFFLFSLVFFLMNVVF